LFGGYGDGIEIAPSQGLTAKN